MNTYVWLIEENVRAVVVGPLGAYFTRVKYSLAGIDYDTLVENDEFVIMEDMEYPVQGTDFDCGLGPDNDD